MEENIFMTAEVITAYLSFYLINCILWALNLRDLLDILTDADHGLSYLNLTGIIYVNKVSVGYRIYVVLEIILRDFLQHPQSIGWYYYAAQVL